MEKVISDSERFQFSNNELRDYFKVIVTSNVLGSTFNIPVSFSVITGFSGGSYASQDATVSSNLYDFNLFLVECDSCNNSYTCPNKAECGEDKRPRQIPRPPFTCFCFILIRDILKTKIS